MKNDSPYWLFLDTETGGIGLDKSLLSAAFILTNHDFDVIATLSLDIKPDNKVYNVTAEALSINGINLIENDELGVTYKEAGTLIYKFLDEHTNHGKEKVIPVGKNVYFDLLQVWDKLITRNTWEKFVSYRVFEVSTLAETAKFLDIIPMNIGNSLQALAEYYNLLSGNLSLHTAYDDTYLTMVVMQRILKQIKE